MPVDEKKRKFLKHLGILTAGGLIGMALTKVSSTPRTEILNDISNKRIGSRLKFIWETKDDYDDPRNWEDYNAYLARVNGGETLDVKKTGAPILNEVACAYHTIIPKDETEDKEKDEHLITTYCTGPCKSECPVNVIEMKDNDETQNLHTDDEKYQGKKVPTFKGKTEEVSNASGSKCIGCGKCFRICGYNAMQWINRRED